MNVKVSARIEKLISDETKQSKPVADFEVYMDDFGQMIYMDRPEPQKVTIISDEYGNITIYAA